MMDFQGWRGSGGDGHGGEDQLVQHLYSLRVAHFYGGKTAEKRAPADCGDEVFGEIGVTSGSLA